MAKNEVLTKKIKEVIRKKNLIDTGRMYNTTWIDVWMTDRIFINVKTTDYFIYVNGRYGITNDLINSNEFKIFLGEEYAKQIQGTLERTLAGQINPPQLFNYQPLLLINGF